LPSSIHYVIWQYQVFGVPSPQDYAYWAHYPAWNVRLMTVRALSFSQFLSEELQKANIIYVDDQFVVARLSRK
jgi:hypothetical protein